MLLSRGVEGPARRSPGNQMEGPDLRVCISWCQIRQTREDGAEPCCGLEDGRYPVAYGRSLTGGGVLFLSANIPEGMSHAECVVGR